MKKAVRFMATTAGVAAGAYWAWRGAAWARRSAVNWRARTEAQLSAGSQIAETVLGPVEYAVSGEGPAVLGVHGTPGGYDQILGGFEMFTGPGFQVIAPSRPGYLRTPLSAGRTPAEQADLLVALMDSLLVDRAAVIAASGGGPVGVEMALRHPERVSGLVLLEALVQAKHLGAERITHGVWGSDITAWAMTSLASRAPQLLVPAEYREDPRVLDAVAPIANSTFPINLRLDGMLNDDAQFTDLRELPLGELKVPVLIVHGDEDRNVPYANAEYAARALPTAHLVTIRGGNHNTTLFARQTQEAIGAFLKACG